MELPNDIIEPVISEPRFIILTGKPKSGKTSNSMALPNSLLIDLENSAEFYPGRHINVQKEAVKEGKTILEILGMVINLLKKELKENGKNKYDFLIIDSATILEDIASIHATKTFKEMAAGKNYKGDDIVADYAQTYGYKLLRESFEKILYTFLPLCNKCVILIVHIKDKDILDDVSEKVISTKELNLVGKLKLIIPAKADGIASIVRKDSKNIISFKADNKGIAFGVREQYHRLNDEEFLLSEMIDNKLHTYWETVFPSITTNTAK